MDWEFVRTIVAISVGFAAWDGIKFLIDCRKWQRCPVKSCNFRFKTNEPGLSNTLMQDHVQIFHPEEISNGHQEV